MQMRLGDTRLYFEDAGEDGVRIVRRWEPYGDGLSWRSDPRSTRLWTIAGPNVLRAASPFAGRRFCSSLNKRMFDPRQNSVTLENFIFNRDAGCFLHLGDNLLSFTTRQINYRFFEREFWPRCNGLEVRPSVFLKRYARIPSTVSLSFCLRSIEQWTESKRRLAA